MVVNGHDLLLIECPNCQIEVIHILSDPYLDSEGETVFTLVCIGYRGKELGTQR